MIDAKNMVQNGNSRWRPISNQNPIYMIIFIECIPENLFKLRNKKPLDEDDYANECQY